MRVPNLFASREMRVNMTPMIDVVFLLIIFFLVSSHLARQEHQLPLQLPQARSGQEDPIDRQRVVVNVTANRQLQVAGRDVQATQLTELLQQQRRQEGPGLEVRIRSDRSVPYETVQPVLTAVTEAGIANVTFSVVRVE